MGQRLNEADPAQQKIRAIILVLAAQLVEAESVSLAQRPVPEDGLPVLGPVPGVAGLWLAVLHSGVTLGPVAGELLAAEVTGKGEQPLLAAFRPARLLHP